MEEIFIIKEKEELITIKKLTKALEEHKDKELMIHLWIVGKEEGKDQFLISTPEILGSIDRDRFNMTLIIGEWELEEGSGY